MRKRHAYIDTEGEEKQRLSEQIKKFVSPSGIPSVRIYLRCSLKYFVK